MSELGETERALLALAGDAHDPTDADRARVRAMLSARLGVAAGLGAGAIGVATTAKAAAGAASVKVAAAGATGVASTTATVAVAGAAVTTKLIVVAVAITATVGVGASVKLARRHAQRDAAARVDRPAQRTAAGAPRVAALTERQRPEHDEPPAEAPLPASPAPEAQVREAPPVPAARAPAAATQYRLGAPDVGAPVPPPLAPEASPPIPTVAPPSEAVATALAQSPARSVPAKGAADQACGPNSPGANRPDLTVADEARLVHDGVRALRDGQAACALSLLDTHAHFFPSGVLAPEREAERALALAALGRIADARAAGAAFVRKYPTSPLSARLRQRIPGIDVGGGTPGRTP